jgi:hypothetical protein
LASMSQSIFWKFVTSDQAVLIHGSFLGTTPYLTLIQTKEGNPLPS